MTVTVEVQPRLLQPAAASVPCNGSGRADRVGGRAPAVLREGAVRSRRLGHGVLGSTDQEASLRATAGTLHVARNTVTYRVKRAEELLATATAAGNSLKLRLALEIARTLLG
ncbi:PucR C-terminal helix-turn-helix domain-containing protein [Streptomyces sp. 2133.1]|nr:PucR C-terminal helix-turn-helix domain-containing protein [Streptomyces sp. 2133.1]